MAQTFFTVRGIHACNWKPIPHTSYASESIYTASMPTVQLSRRSIPESVHSHYMICTFGQTESYTLVQHRFFIDIYNDGPGPANSTADIVHSNHMICTSFTKQFFISCPLFVT